MKNNILYLAILIAALTGYSVANAAGNLKGKPFVHTICVKDSGSGSKTGNSCNDAKPILNSDNEGVADLWEIPAGTVIEKVYLIIDSAFTGTTNFDVGDDDSANGFIDSSVSVTLGSTGAYGYSHKNAGAYLSVGAGDGSGEQIKYYSASGKSLKLSVAGSNSVGTARIVVEGYVL